MSTGTSCHFGHMLQVSKKVSLKSDFIQFFHDFIHVHSLGQGQTAPKETKFWYQQKYLFTSFICCKLKKNVFEVWFYIIFFHDLIHVYSPGAGTDTPQGTKFWGQQKCLVTSFISCKSLKKSLCSLILYNFFHDFIHVYSPKAGADNPLAT